MGQMEHIGNMGEYSRPLFMDVPAPTGAVQGRSIWESAIGPA